MSTRGRLIALVVLLLAVTAAGLLLDRPPWPGAGDPGKLREPDSLSVPRDGITVRGGRR